VGITSPSSTGTDPIGDTVGGQGIVIPTDIAFAHCGTSEFIFPVGAQPAIAPAAWRNTAFIGTKVAFHSFLTPGGLPREVKPASCHAVSLLNQGENPGKVSSNTIQA